MLVNFFLLQYLQYKNKTSTYYILYYTVCKTYFIYTKKIYTRIWKFRFFFLMQKEKRESSTFWLLHCMAGNGGNDFPYAKDIRMKCVFPALLFMRHGHNRKKIYFIANERWWKNNKRFNGPFASLSLSKSFAMGVYCVVYR